MNIDKDPNQDRWVGADCKKGYAGVEGLWPSVQSTASVKVNLCESATNETCPPNCPVRQLMNGTIPPQTTP